jgi:hypothetical protein
MAEARTLKLTTDELSDEQLPEVQARKARGLAGRSQILLAAVWNRGDLISTEASAR